MNSITTYRPDKAQLEQGLVSSYGKANAENDINTYAELIFTDPEKIQTYIRTYPIIKKKYILLKAFYLSISPHFGNFFTADIKWKKYYAAAQFKVDIKHYKSVWHYIR